MLAASQHDRSTKLDAKLDAIVVTAGGITATPTFLLMLRGEGPERAARGGGMVGGGRHHTPPPSEDVRRGRSTHTLPPFWLAMHEGTIQAALAINRLGPCAAARARSNRF